jgi:hypothetical protein
MTTNGQQRDGYELVRFLLVNAAIGVGAAVVMVALALAADFMNLWTLVSNNDAGPLALAVMTVFFSITFGSAQMGFALMFAMSNEGPPSSGKWQVVLERLLPGRLPVPALVVVPPTRARR